MTPRTDSQASESDSVLVPVDSLTVSPQRGWVRSGGCDIRFRDVCVKEVVAAMAREC
jgi:hypothetical protein